jgi:hypothetical protein
LPVFYLTVILKEKTWVKKIGQKILPKDGKRMRPVQIFGILAVRELLFRLRYHSFGSLMPGQTCTDTLLISNSHTHFSPSQSHSLSRVNSHPHIHTFSPAHVHSFYLFLTHIFFSLALSLTHTHTHTHTLTHSLTLIKVCLSGAMFDRPGICFAPHAQQARLRAVTLLCGQCAGACLQPRLM